jgi:hypothetical protein
VRPATIVTPQLRAPLLTGEREKFLSSVLDLRPLHKLKYDPNINYASEFIAMYHRNKELLKRYERTREAVRGI